MRNGWMILNRERIKSIQVATFTYGPGTPVRIYLVFKLFSAETYDPYDILLRSVFVLLRGY